jgi:ribosome-associated toxin RatA of RatAB toxin-antitoxin module
MLMKVLLGIVGLCVLLAVIGLLLPGTVRVERSITITRPPATVFAVVNDQRQFTAWSPWTALDPNATYTLSGPPTGPGAALSWSSTTDMGVGTQRIVASVPDSRIDVVLEMEGFNAATSTWQFEPSAEGTRVTWAFECELGSNPLMRWMGLFMDRFVGPDYARGLSGLKAYIENAPAAGG